jgi:hypothetical protein
MKRALVIAAICACAGLPGIAAAQQSGPPGPPPSPAMRAAFEQARADARAAALAALTPAHAASVQAILAQATSGTLDRRTAAQQIDAVLSPDERTAVLAAAEKARRGMRAAMNGMPPPPPPGAGAPPQGAPPQGPPPQGPPPGGPRMFGPPTAGRVLVMLSMAPGGRRSTLPTARSTSAP